MSTLAVYNTQYTAMLFMGNYSVVIKKEEKVQVVQVMCLRQVTVDS